MKQTSPIPNAKIFVVKSPEGKYLHSGTGKSVWWHDDFGKAKKFATSGRAQSCIYNPINGKYPEVLEIDFSHVPPTVIDSKKAIIKNRRRQLNKDIGVARWNLQAEQSRNPQDSHRIQLRQDKLRELEAELNNILNGRI